MSDNERVVSEAFLIEFLCEKIDLWSEWFRDSLPKVQGNDETMLRIRTADRALMVCQLQRRFLLELPIDKHLMLFDLLANFSVY